MTGVILHTGSKWILAHNIPAQPQLDSYIQDKESGLERYTTDSTHWFEYLQKARLIDIEDKMQHSAYYYLLQHQGKSVEYTTDGYYAHVGEYAFLTGHGHKSSHYFVVSRYQEHLLWLEQYTNLSYTVYNKGPNIDYLDTTVSDNFGGNQYDICRFIYDNYDHLPEVIVFLQGNPFDHCCKTTFDNLIDNITFTPIEDYSHVPESDIHRKGHDGGYMELNNSWFVEAHNITKGLLCKYPTFDTFMHSVFYDYQHIEWIRFTPGSQYIVTRENCTRYSRNFWKHLMDQFPTTEVNGGTEAHIIERAFYYIFTGQFHTHL